MPLYEYRCRRCDKDFEKIVSSATKKVSCPHCRSKKVEKQFSLFGVKSGGVFTSSKGGDGCSSCKASSCKNCK